MLLFKLLLSISLNLKYSSVVSRFGDDEIPESCSNKTGMRIMDKLLFN
jgi:hypothetical protein